MVYCKQLLHCFQILLPLPTIHRAIAITVTLMNKITPNSNTSFGHSDNNFIVSVDWDDAYVSKLLLANIPQVFLSFCYFSYNTFFTRLVVEQEWNAFSLTPHKPLRVSNPQGAQISSYRLQLPYLYSIPLLAVSVLLHWLLSNSVYLIVDEGTA
jgi:hypothetical protein